MGRHDDMMIRRCFGSLIIQLVDTSILLHIDALTLLCSDTFNHGVDMDYSRCSCSLQRLLMTRCLKLKAVSVVQAFIRPLSEKLGQIRSLGH